jgi:hypothetical protein
VAGRWWAETKAHPMYAATLAKVPGDRDHGRSR